MAELEKNKAGLQKKVSSVFKGVPLPQNSGVQQPAATPAPEAAPRPLAPPASADHPAPQSSILRTLHQGDETPAAAAPVQPSQARPKTAPPQRPMAQPAAPSKPAEKADKIEKPLKAAPTPAKPHKAPVTLVQAQPNLWQKINSKLFAMKPGVSPARQKAMVILIPVLAIVMIFMFRQVLSRSPRRTEAATDANAPLAKAPKPGNEIDWKIPDVLPAINRDPAKVAEQAAATSSTEPNQTAAEPRAGTFDVRDIVYSKDKPSAVVNAHIVYVGHKVDGATVVQILKDGVEFERNGKKWVEKVHD